MRLRDVAGEALRARRLRGGERRAAGVMEQRAELRVRRARGGERRGGGEGWRFARFAGAGGGGDRPRALVVLHGRGSASEDRRGRRPPRGIDEDVPGGSEPSAGASRGSSPLEEEPSSASESEASDERSLAAFAAGADARGGRGGGASGVDARGAGASAPGGAETTAPAGTDAGSAPPPPMRTARDAATPAAASAARGCEPAAPGDARGTTTRAFFLDEKRRRIGISPRGSTRYSFKRAERYSYFCCAVIKCHQPGFCDLRYTLDASRVFLLPLAHRALLSLTALSLSLTAPPFPSPPWRPPRAPPSPPCRVSSPPFSAPSRRSPRSWPYCASRASPGM